MKQHELTDVLVGLFAIERTALISPTLGIVARGGGLAILPAEEFEAGDMIVVPPSLVTQDAPTQGYILGCIEKCWPQLQNLPI